MSAKTVQDKIIEQFQNDAVCAATFGAQINRGFGKNVKLSEVGQMLNIAFTGEADVENKISKAPTGGNKIRVAYTFYISVAFYEPDETKAEERKTTYPAMIKNAIDSDLTFGLTCIGITKIGSLTIAEIPYSNGVYFGEVMLLCIRDEIRGQR